jgi:sulfite exporter TauE/SafE
MMLWSAFLLGLAGSLHCAGMCGPLMLALPGGGTKPASLLLKRLTHHAGRLTIYALLGLLLGRLGESLALIGLQRWVSIAAGVAILLTLLLTPNRLWQFPVGGFLSGIRGAFGNLLRRDTASARFLLGALNGLLPCGLVYVAAAGSLAAGDRIAGIAYMLAFGIGTLPLLLTISLAGQRFAFQWTPVARKAVPLLIGLAGIMLVLRGMDLGIPYLSPSLNDDGSFAIDCH